MPTYSLLCNIDPSTVSARTTGEDTLNVGVRIGQASPVVANTSDIKEGTILSWRDVITVNVLNASGARVSGPYTIDFGQTLEGRTENNDEIYAVHNDSRAPRYGFQYTTVGGGSLEVHQTFGRNDLVFTTQWYDPGSYAINLSPDFAVWFASNANDKYTVSFVNTATQIIYCNLEGTWSLAGPHLFAAGTVVKISQGSGGYIIGQPHSQKGKGGSSLMAPPVGNIATRRAISFSFGPLVLEGYIDISSYEIGVDVSLFGIELGVLYGNLAEGVVLHVDLVAASGLVRLYLKHPDTDTTELWVLIDLKVSMIVQTEYVQDVLIMSW